jgi:hypothetical protein
VARLNKQEALEKRFEFETRDVDVPALGGSILIRRLSMHADSEAAAALFDDKGAARHVSEMTARRIQASAVEPAFSLAEVRTLMRNYPSEALRPLVEAIDELNGRAEDVEEASAEAEAEFHGPEEERSEVPVSPSA